MDGRAQLPVIRYLKRKYRAAFVDMITEPGIVRTVAAAGTSAVRRSVKKRLAISENKHGSGHVALVAHHDCAGNPVSDQRQKAQLKAGVARLKTEHPTLAVVGLWLGPGRKVRKIA